MLLAVHQVMMLRENLESTQEAQVVLGCASINPHLMMHAKAGTCNNIVKF